MKKLTPFKIENIALVRKRLNEMGVNISQAERESGVPADTIQKMLEGSGTDYEKYVAVMKYIRYAVPLYGKLISGRGIVMEDMATLEKQHVPISETVEYSTDLLAILVDDDRYEPRYFRGTILYFRSTANNVPGNLQSKHPYVVKRLGIDSDVMIIRPGTIDGAYNLLSVDGSSTIVQNAQLEWCAPIEGTKWEY